MKALEKSIEHIQIEKISFDKNNPRGEKEEQIVTDPEFDKLKLSINKYGILEPLIVKKDTNKEDYYILIDGERRLRAATKIAENDKSSYQNQTVPALTAKDEADGRILAYQVHMLRKNWNKAAETKSIKRIIADLRQATPDITDKDLAKRIKEITAHTDYELGELLKLIKYSDVVIGKVLSNELDMSYLIQIESSFINPLKRKYPELLKDNREDQIRNILVYKAEEGLLVNTRFLMDKFKHVFADEKHKDSIKRLIEKFLKNKNENIQDIFKSYLIMNKKLDPKLDPVKSIQGKKKVKGIKTDHKSFNNYGKIILSKHEEGSIKTVRENFESIYTKLSQEEREYIAEAVSCFEARCHKAAIVMVWAAGISKIINYHSKDITKFNSDCHKMTNINKIPFKYYKDVLAKAEKYSTIDDLRNGIDMPFILWLLNQNVISMTEFKKLKADYDTRCDCAHPTDIKLNFHEVIKIFNNVHRLIFANIKL
ncbi:MAG: ParB N-terminal domain-containing protein [Bacteroidota bacterium]